MRWVICQSTLIYGRPGPTFLQFYGEGSYSSVIQRGTLSSTTGTNYYIKLSTFYNKCYIPILSDSQNLQIRVYIDQLVNFIALCGGTGTASATINYAHAVCKVLKLPFDIASNRLIAMGKKAEQ